MKVDRISLQLPQPLRLQRQGLSLPLASDQVAAGFPSPADDYIEVGIDLNEQLIRHPSSTFFLRVSGDSMTGAGIHHGDLLVVDRSLDPRPGRVVVAVLDGSFTLKRLARYRGRSQHYDRLHAACKTRALGGGCSCSMPPRGLAPRRAGTVLPGEV